jgi:hypothetical protein
MATKFSSLRDKPDTQNTNSRKGYHIDQTFKTARGLASDYKAEHKVGKRDLQPF